jgi:hypothetical protein
MPRRIRSLHPDRLDDKRLSRLSHGARLLSADVLLLCDDEGRCQGDEDWLRSQVWPYGTATAREVSGFLAELEGITYLRRYSVGGETYLQVKRFTRYQHPQKPQPSRIPPPPPLPVEDEYTTGTLPVQYGLGSGSGSGLGSGEGVEQEGRTEVRSRGRRAEPESPPADLSPLCAFLTSTWPDVRAPWLRETSWAAAYPGVDLLAEARRAQAWEDANPAKRKVKHERFLVSWWTRAQDRGGAVAGAPGPRVCRTQQVLPAAPASAFVDEETGF